MFPIELDIRTLSLITVLFSLMFGAGLVAFGITHQGISGLKRVGAGLILIGLCFLLIGLRHLIPAVLSIVVANTILLLGFTFINRGIQDFRKVSRSDTWLCTTVMTFNTLALLYFTFIEPSFYQRVLWVSISLFILTGVCCRTVIKESAGNLIMPQKILALGFGLPGVFSLVRAVWVLNEGAGQDFMKASTIHGMAFLALILLLLSVTFGLIWMANEYLFQELKLYEQIILTTPEGIALVDKNGRYRLVNDALLNLLGLSRQEMLGKQSMERFGTCITKKVPLPNLHKAFAGEAGTTSTWLDLPNAEKLYVTIKSHPVPDANGHNAFAAIHIQNLTQLHVAQKERQRIFDLSLDMLSVMAMDGSFKEVNPAWTETLGWSQEELLQSRWIEYIHPGDVFETIAAERNLNHGEPVVDFVNRWQTKDGSFRHIAWMASPDVEHETIYCVARDITDRVLREEELVTLSTTDSLTGAKNRRLFMQKLYEEVERSHRYNTSLSLVVLDIDYFKKVNDTHGHAVGDKVLKRCVDICNNELRSTDIFGRVGGEEFSVILPFADIHVGYETAERLRKKLSQSSANPQSGIPSFTVSIGVAELRPDDTPDSFCQRADAALYRAKNGGRNRVERE